MGTEESQSLWSPKNQKPQNYECSWSYLVHISTEYYTDKYLAPTAPPGVSWTLTGSWKKKTDKYFEGYKTN